MSSIALFPCVFTGTATTIGELGNSLRTRPYTDNDLIHDTIEAFGGEEKRLQKQLFGRISVFNKFTLEKEMAMARFRITLSDILMQSETNIFSGFHTILFPPSIREVLRVVIVDTGQERISRGMKEGLSEKKAKEFIHAHDVKAYTLTDFLYKKEAYDKELYDVVIPVESRSPVEISKEIMKYLQNVSVLRTLDSQQAVKNMRLAAQAQLVMLEKGHNLPVEVIGDSLVVTISNAHFLLKSLERDISRIVQNIDGIDRVEFREVKTHEACVYRQQKFELPSRVLFVDDEKDFVHTVSERLISRDVGTFGVFNGEQALEMVLEDPPDVMVLDLKMPGLHGTEVLQKVKSIKPEIEVIILTGHGNIKDEQRCMELGAFGYLTKPVDIELLSETIKSADAKLHNRQNNIKYDHRQVA